MLVGATLMGLVWLKLGTPPVDSPFARTAPPAEKAQASTASIEATEPATSTETPPEVPPPRFEYPSLLPEMEVVIPPDELKPEAPEAKPVAPVTAPPAVEQAGTGPLYDLQLGSFSKRADSDRMKASLALLGITARIEKVTVDGRGTYFRVRAGPYNRDQAYSLHEQLDKNGVDNQIYRISK